MKKVIRFLKGVLLVIISALIILISILLIIPITQKALIGVTGFGLTLYGFNETGLRVSSLMLNEKYNLTGKVYRSLSVQHTKNGNYGFAINALEKAVSMDETCKDYYGWVLLYYYRDYERAYQVLQEYDELTPEFSDFAVGENVNYLKGLALLKMDRFEEAITEFDKYIENEIKAAGEDWVDVYAFVNKGIALARLGQHDLAIEEYNRAIENYENCTEAYYYKSISLLEENRLEAALAFAEYSSELIGKGFKHEENYIELFHEIYPSQTSKLIRKIDERLKEKFL